MTNMQIRFLKAIYECDKTAEELCKELKIEPYTNDALGGYYNALNTGINYLSSDDGNEIDCMFSIYNDNSPSSNNDRYSITKEGKKYIEDYIRERKNEISGTNIGIIGIIIAVVAIIVSVIISIN
jgi:hypothetical protein